MLLEVLQHGLSHGDAVSVAGGGPQVTYGGLRRQVDSLASELLNLGLGAGDRIAIALPNGLEMIASFLAAATVGTAAPLNPAYKLEEFRFYLDDTGARALILPPNGGEEARAAAGDRVLIVETHHDSDGEVLLSSNSRAGPARTRTDPKPDDVALILHTSGTTSRPKRVPLSHANLLVSARNVAETYKLGPEDVSFCVMPLFHVHGLVASTLATLLTGGAVVLMPRFNALSFWPTVKERRVSWYSAVPTIHQILLARAKGGARPAGAENLRFIRSCSAALAPATMAEMEERFGAPVLEAYGMTEAAHQMASNPLPPGVRKPGSVGPGTAVEITLLDEHSERVPLGTPGEVAIKGPNVFGGYEGNAEANAESFTHGWFRTGDRGYLDDDGYLVLVGRIKEMINYGGEKISPREIDEALLSHPAVSEAVCFGVPDRVYGERVAAAVVLNGTASEAELISYCRSLVADFKCPSTVYIVDSIPRGATGKIQRRTLASVIAGIDEPS